MTYRYRRSVLILLFAALPVAVAACRSAASAGGASPTPVAGGGASGGPAVTAGSGGTGPAGVAAGRGGAPAGGVAPAGAPSDAGTRPLPLPAPILTGGLDPDARGWVDEVLAGLTLEAAVGQLVFPWMTGGYTAEDDPAHLEAMDWVDRWGVGGIAISIGTPYTYAARLNALQARSAIPLLVSSDFENGGPGMRINHSYALPTLLAQGGGTSFPPTMAFGAVGDELEVQEYARITAREARAVGVHLNFSPVLDVNSNPQNPIINTRSFGESPSEVARLGRAFLRGARSGGALSTAKHFPGHGDTGTDSHLAIASVTADRARLDAVELVPFRAAVEEGVDAVMTAHVSMPGILGPESPPATLSPEVMTSLLREEMGFQGLLLTDALSMGAIANGFGAGEAAVRALEAGADILLIPASVPDAVQAVVAAVRSGRVTRARVDESVRRILEAKARVGLHEERLVSLEEIPRVVGIREHRVAADRVAARSITLPRDRDGLLPLATGARVLSVTYGAPEELAAGREFDTVLRGLVGEVASVRIVPTAREDELNALLTRAAGFDALVFNAYVPPRAGAGTVALPAAVASFVRSAAAARPTVMISFGNPYLLLAVPEVRTYVLAWGDREVSQRAAARAISGVTGIEGRLPITLPGLHARGEGIVREPSRGSGSAGPVVPSAGQL